MAKMYAILGLLMCFLGSCSVSQPISTKPPQNNSTYNVSYLFEHDGCKVYRFTDRGNTVYFTNCNGESISYPDSTTVIRSRTNRQ
ncbi:MAG: DUF4884 domain-containing protein [Lewinellaceae bacterium]|nr:DUF4884 domain-containing protein [Lewinellaceae bacterium]